MDANVTLPTPDGEARPRVFISYARRDRHLAEQFDSALRAAGFDAIWDHNLQAGTGFTRSIENFIAHAHVFMPLITETSDTRQWVHQEIGFARALNVPILPVSFDVAPEGLVGELHSARCDDPPSDAQVSGILARIPNLIDEASITSIPLYRAAKESPLRAQMIGEYCRTVSFMDRCGVVRQRSLGSSFSIPDKFDAHPLWRDRYDSERELLVRDPRLMRSEHRGLAHHARAAGCRLILDLDRLARIYTETALRARLIPLRSFLRGLRDVDVFIGHTTAEDQERSSASVTAVGDWFIAEAVRASQAYGWRQTMFTTHTPTILNEIGAFDEELTEILNHQEGGAEGSLDHTLGRIARLLGDDELDA